MQGILLKHELWQRHNILTVTQIVEHGELINFTQLKQWYTFKDNAFLQYVLLKSIFLFGKNWDR